MQKTYAYHKPSDKSIQGIRDVREAYSHIHQAISQLCPASRELSVALTNLEQSAMWAIKSIVCNDPESKIEE